MINVTITKAGKVTIVYNSGCEQDYMLPLNHKFKNVRLDNENESVVDVTLAKGGTIYGLTKESISIER